MSGWAGALGAAILGGQKAYRDADALKREREQLALENEMRQAQMADAHKSALQAAILNQDRINELPKVHARADMEDFIKLQGSGAYGNQKFLDAADVAGIPIARKNITKARVDSIEQQPSGLPDGLNPGGAVPSNNQAARQMGVDPTTGAVIPSQLIQEDLDRQRKGAIDQLQLNNLQQFSTGGGYELDPQSGLPANSPANRAKEAFDPQKRISAMYGPASEMPQNVAARERAQAGVKAEIPSATMARVTGGMSETIDNLTRAQQELERLFPGINSPDDPQKNPWEQPYNGPLDLAKAKGLRVAYNFMDTPYNKAIQAASLGNVQGWAGLVPGRLNPAIVAKATEHQSAFGNETPRATYSRNRELIDMLSRNRQDLLTPQRAAMPQQAAAPQAAPPPGPLSVGDVEGRKPAVPQAQSAPGLGAPAAKGSKPPVPMSKVTALANAKGVSPRDIINRIYQEGGTVVVDSRDSAFAPQR
jgi:hypothetical protein